MALLATIGACLFVTPARGAPTKALAPQTLRAATPGISLASLILALGGPDALAAAAPEVKANPWLRRILPRTTDLPTPFVRPAGVDRESLLAVKPDLIVLWSEGPAAIPALDASGIPVLRLAYADPAQMEAGVRRLGAALGPTASRRAEAWIRDFEQNRARVATVLAPLSARRKPRVYYASIAPLLTEGSGTMVDAWITGAGGVNVAALAGLHGDAQAHLEDVLAWNPEIIVTQRQQDKRSILADPRWRDVAAVRGGRVVVNPGGVNAWCTRAAEASLQVLWAAQVFHPEQFSKLDLAAETRRFYRQYYAYELSDDEVARILRGEGPGDDHPGTDARKP